MMITKCQEELQVEQETRKTNLSLWKGRLMLCARPDGHLLTGDSNKTVQYGLLRFREWLEVLEGVDGGLSLTISWLFRAPIMGFANVTCHVPNMLLTTSHCHGLMSLFDTKKVSGQTCPQEGHSFDQICISHPGFKECEPMETCRLRLL